MIVRCGRCRAELEVAGSGEFMCPSCGTRNVVRGPAGPQPYGLGGNASGLTIPGGAPAPAPGGAAPPEAPTALANWARCPACSHRFAIGEVEKVTCPNCRAELLRDEAGELVAESG